MKKMIIGKRVVERGKITPPYFIAEIGVNHEGNLEKAKLMIEQAAKAGADAVKFQTYKADKLASKFSPAYWDTQKEPTETQYKLFKKFDKFDRKEYEILAKYANEFGLDFLSTPFDFEAVDMLEDLVPAYKIASADITNYPLIEYIASKGKPIILSTGASTISEIYKAIEVIRKKGKNNQVALLHCVLNYPTNSDKANIGMIVHMNKIFPDYIIGYSDHTVPPDSIEILFIAWLLGAQIIEKHFTFDKTLPGNDHYHSFDEKDLKEFREKVNFAMKAIGSFHKDYLPEEEISRLNARRSLVAKHFIKKGSEIRIDDLEIKRPGTGIPPALIEYVVGGVALRDIEKDEIITFDSIQFSGKSKIRKK